MDGNGERAMQNRIVSERSFALVVLLDQPGMAWRVALRLTVGIEIIIWVELVLGRWPLVVVNEGWFPVLSPVLSSWHQSGRLDDSRAHRE